MTETPSASDWAAARGDKWRDQLSFMEAMLAPVDGPLIGALALDAPVRIADIGCGGGGTTVEIARRAPDGSIVHGFDISPALIAAARARADGVAVTFTLADVGAAPAPEPPFDRLTSRFGIMFYDDPPSAFARLAHWLSPGGRFAFAVWGPPPDNPWMTSVRDVAAEVIDVPAPDPDAPGPFRYAGADTLLRLLDHAGFRDVAVNDWRGRLALGGGLAPEDAADFALQAFAVGDLVAGAGEAVRERVRRSLAEHFARHVEDGAVRMAARVHIVTGTR